MRHRLGHGVHTCLCLFGRGLHAGKVQLDLAAAGENGRLYILVALVNRRGTGVDLRLRDQGHAQQPFGQVARGQRGGQPRFALLIEQRLQLLWRPRQQDDDLAAALHNRVQPLPWRAAVAVGQQRSAVEHLGLLFVIWRHGHAPLSEALVQRGHRGIVLMHADVERCRYAGPREIILGRSKSAGEDHHIRTSQGNARRLRQVLTVVADDGLERNRNTQIVQTLGDVQRIRILTKGRQHLRADGNDFSDHVAGLDAPSWPRTWLMSAVGP